VRFQFLALSSALLVFTELAGPIAASSAESLGPVSKCGEVPPREVVLDEGQLVRPVALPSNLEVTLVFRPLVDRMWLSSPTFRQQLHRLAAGTALRVRVLVGDRRSALFNARTVLTQQQHHSLTLAEVNLTPSLGTAASPAAGQWT